MVNVEVKNTERVINNMRTFRNDLKGENMAIMADVCIYLMNYIQTNKLSGQVLKRRTGRLVGAMNYAVRDEAGNVVGRVGNSAIYAHIHEFGKTITAKNSKYLTIPLPAAMTPAGVLRKPARQWENTFVSSGIIWQRKEKGQRSIPLFVLKKSVTIPARPYFSTGLKETQPEIFKLIGHAVDTAVIKTNSKV
jgi:phage gpG-like protein